MRYRYSDFQFDSAQRAVITLLLLRGPQTPGELRSRSGRLHDFADNADVVVTLTSLIERDGDPLLVKLPRTPGRKDSEYMHLLSGPVDAAAHATRAEAAKASTAPARPSTADLESRVSRLEREVAELKQRLGE